MNEFEFLKEIINDAIQNGHEVHIEKKNYITDNKSPFSTGTSSDSGLSIHIYPIAQEEDQNDD